MAIKMKTTVQLKATADCPSHALSKIAIRDITFNIDEPTERGGTNTGPTPTDTAISALVGCTNVIAHKCATSLGIDIGHLKIDATCDFNRLGVTLSEEVDVPFERIHLKVQSDGAASAEELQSVRKEVSKFCPLAKLFSQAGTIIDEEWIKST